MTDTSVATKRPKVPQVGRDVVATLVRKALNLSSDREANNVVTDSIIAVVTANIEVDGFTLKLPCFGKFEVRHTQGKMRKIPLTGKIQMTADKRKIKFIPLARLHYTHRQSTRPSSRVWSVGYFANNQTVDGVCWGQ